MTQRCAVMSLRRAATAGPGPRYRLNFFNCCTAMNRAGHLTTRLLLVTAVLMPFGFVGLFLFHESDLPPVRRPDRSSGQAVERLSCQRLELAEFQEWRPRITNVNIVDLDRDGRQDVLVCDAVRQAVWWCRQSAPDEFQRVRISEDRGIAASCHTSVVDIDGDSDLDVLVAVLRSIWPTDRRVGQVVLLENTGEMKFVSHVLLEDVRRITDVQPADFDGDGDIDLAVAEFGYLHGSVFWMENQGDLTFKEHELISRAGAIHVPLQDYDQDGDIDIAAVVSQDAEEVWIFDNDGAAAFTPQRIWATPNFDLGSAGMISSDLDQDGDWDLILSAGDNFEYVFPSPQPYHGCIWLENNGQHQFVPHTLGYVPGCYASAAADFDADGDIDVVAGSMFPDRSRPDVSSVTLLRNDGQQNFTRCEIAETTTHISTIACGDLDGDDRVDIVIGSMQTFEPFDDSPAVSILSSAAQ